MAFLCMQEQRTASSVQNIEIVGVFMMFSTTLLAMEEEHFYPFNNTESSAVILYEQQRANCVASVLDSIEQYILVLPTELGCYPCQYFNYMLNSFKYQHVEERKGQLIRLKNHIQENGLCEADVKIYIENVMGNFSGDYGQKFKQICTGMIDNLSLILKTLAKDQVQQCLLCKQKPADKEYYCGHKTTCVSCDNKRLYHRCPICNEEDKKPIEIGPDEEEKSLLDQGADQECKICFDSPRNAVFLSCGHAQVCEPCGQQVKDCPFCRIKISGILKIDENNRIELCSVCHDANPEVINLSCNHITICISCHENTKDNNCGLCEHKISNNTALKMHY